MVGRLKLNATQVPGDTVDVWVLTLYVMAVRILPLYDTTFGFYRRMTRRLDSTAILNDDKCIDLVSLFGIFIFEKSKKRYL
jgi:hypothetical protein